LGEGAHSCGLCCQGRLQAVAGLDYCARQAGRQRLDELCYSWCGFEAELEVVGVGESTWSKRLALLGSRSKEASGCAPRQMLHQPRVDARVHEGNWAMQTL